MLEKRNKWFKIRIVLRTLQKGVVTPLFVWYDTHLANVVLRRHDNEEARTYCRTRFDFGLTSWTCVCWSSREYRIQTCGHPRWRWDDSSRSLWQQLLAKFFEGLGIFPQPLIFTDKKELAGEKSSLSHTI